MKEFIYPIMLAISLMMNGYLGSLAITKEKPDTVVEVVRTSDTIHIQREIVTNKFQLAAPIEVQYFDTVYLRDTLQMPLDTLLAERVYQDSVESAGAKLHYRHEVLGVMQNSQYTFTIPERHITDREVRTEYETIRPKWSVHGMAGVDYSLGRTGVSFGGAVQYQQVGAYYLYTPNVGSHVVGLSARVLSK